MKAVLDKIAESLEGEVTLEPEWLSEHVDVMNFRVNALTISRTCLRILYPQLNFPLKSRGRDPESDTTRNQILKKALAKAPTACSLMRLCTKAMPETGWASL